MMDIRNIKWKTIGAIMMVSAAMIFERPIIFGLLYIAWAISDIRSGEAYIIENIRKEENPVLYWIIVALWMFSGLYMIWDEIWKYIY